MGQGAATMTLAAAAPSSRTGALRHWTDAAAGTGKVTASTTSDRLRRGESRPVRCLPRPRHLPRSRLSGCHRCCRGAGDRSQARCYRRSGRTKKNDWKSKK
ncbi:hypothetical protein MRX96_015679 [Rhipicephalus microplus]